MKSLSRRPFVIAALASAMLLAGCDQPKATSDQTMNRQQEQASADAAATVGFPAIRNYQEKRFMKLVLELRDKPNLTTYTYVSTMDGRLVKRCDSIGYGLPYATQYTSPQKDIYVGTNSTVHMAMPQADPNGLFSPASADGTWVLCVNPKTREPMPVYIEDRVTVSPFELN